MATITRSMRRLGLTSTGASTGSTGVPNVPDLHRHARFLASIPTGISNTPDWYTVFGTSRFGAMEKAKPRKETLRARPVLFYPYHPYKHPILLEVDQEQVNLYICVCVYVSVNPSCRARRRRRASCANPPHRPLSRRSRS